MLKVHKHVSAESTLKACYLGPLVVTSPRTQCEISENMVEVNLRTIVINDGK